MIIDDIIVNKIQVIERCLKRIDEEYEQNPKNLLNYTKQDSIILNLQRAIEAAIDIAIHLCAVFKFGVPQSSREAFDLLEEKNIVSKELAKRLKAMVGFRNIVVHDYQAINLEILKNIIEKNLSDFLEFKDAVLNFLQKRS
ncbi:protein of unknown function DUF86 [Caldicellulosiruptor owensensis OL]|uniref:DUF86 domain-containing protein n=1 Tax=Caldicellulosiruptor owensensis (strain ATCC 700167 / DSM 13100 / OL) TaxID=632518 RepID=E4Q699_CALOW|nr:HepT-like ribonuclease domain-containing protein [Caldicellulosiruptor owensensis]ADQ05584.1 protein of unknown function DUF86 [Caldicellulosiruptor owensensis OL]